MWLVCGLKSKQRAEEEGVLKSLAADIEEKPHMGWLVQLDIPKWKGYNYGAMVNLFSTSL